MKFRFLSFALIGLLLFSCNTSDKKKITETEPTTSVEVKTDDDFEYVVEEFADLRILRYNVPGWDHLTAKQKEYVYYLSQAGLEGRDILWDQNYRHNLKIRGALENIYTNFNGDKTTNDWKEFELYLKQVWFANGIHHHYSNDKFKAGFSPDYLKFLLTETDTELTGEAFDVIFNDKDAKKVNLDESKGLIEGSAVNFYGPGITADEVDDYYHSMVSPNPKQPLSFGLNSKLIKKDGKLEDLVYKSGGMYGAAIDQMITWLDKAKAVAENEAQAEALEQLVQFYKTGDLAKWDDHSVAWVKATDGDIDFIHGFIEVYGDPKGYKATFESVVQITDFEMSEKMEIVGHNAQWFEDNSPIFPEHKKENVVGVTYKTVNVAAAAGDVTPSSPIGINLPNADWIREQVGSKSVSLGNIIHAYGQSGSTGRLKEFAYSEEEIELSKKYGGVADNIHTTLHEVVGHASGKLAPGVAEPAKTLKSYASTIEEGRADLVGLYYLPDPKMQELGLTDDYVKLGKAAYNDYIRNGMMTQLIRINPGNDIEESHMRNRAWVSRWAYEKGKADNVIEKKVENGKTYFVVNDHKKLRDLFGQLLREVQRIKSEGDFDAARDLVENYGVKVDPKLHQEVLDRNTPLSGSPYSGFMNPVLAPVMDNNGNITDVQMTHAKNFAEQMLDYSSKYGNLPDEN